MKTSAIANFVHGVSSFGNKGLVNLVQTRANETRFCSERFDITYDMTANPFHNDSLLKFEKRLELMVEEIVDGISEYLHHNRQVTKCDRGTSPLFTKGGTTQEAMMQKHYRLFNGTIATRPGTNSCGDHVNESTYMLQIKAFIMMSILNFHHAQRDKQPFFLANLKNQYSGDTVHYEARSLCRILLYKDMLGSNYDTPADEEFLLLITIFCDSFGIGKGTILTYADGIEKIADYLAEAHAVRWSMDCGGHYDKLTCEHFPHTLAYSFHHNIDRIRNKWLRECLAATSHPKLIVTIDKHNRIISPSNSNQIESYQNCMIAAYSRKFFHDSSLSCSSRSRLMESDMFCPIARLVCFFLSETKGTLLDYYHIFENEKSVTELFDTIESDTSIIEKATLSLGRCYKTPQSFIRMVSSKPNLMSMKFITIVMLTCVHISLF